jgi:hypothetical protein
MSWLDKIRVGSRNESIISQLLLDLKMKKFMHFKQEIESIMKIADKHEQRVKLAELSFRLEMDTSIEDSDVVELVENVIRYIFKERDQGVKDDLFNVIDDAVFLRQVGEKVNWDLLVDTIQALSTDDLVWVFPFLGASKKEQYVSLLLPYVNHANATVRNYAIDAVTEIQSNVSSNDPTFKEYREEVLSAIRNKKKS